MTQGAKTMLFNPNPTPVVCDTEGRIVDGGGRRQVDKVDEVAQEAIDNGLLVLEKPEEPPAQDDEQESSEAAPKGKLGASAPKKTS